MVYWIGCDVRKLNEFSQVQQVWSADDATEGDTLEGIGPDIEYHNMRMPQIMAWLIVKEEHASVGLFQGTHVCITKDGRRHQGEALHGVSDLC